MRIDSAVFMNSATVAAKDVTERISIDDIALVLQQNRLRWYGHVLQREDDDWVKKGM